MLLSPFRKKTDVFSCIETVFNSENKSIQSKSKAVVSFAFTFNETPNFSAQKELTVMNAKSCQRFCFFFH